MLGRGREGVGGGGGGQFLSCLTTPGLSKDILRHILYAMPSVKLEIAETMPIL